MAIIDKNDPAPNGSTQKRKAHVERMQRNSQWDSKTTPAEDPARPGYRLPPRGQRYDAATDSYIEA